jgi:hypothetical protein
MALPNLTLRLQGRESGFTPSGTENNRTDGRIWTEYGVRGLESVNEGL